MTACYTNSYTKHHSQRRLQKVFFLSWVFIYANSYIRQGMRNPWCILQDAPHDTLLFLRAGCFYIQNVVALHFHQAKAWVAHVRVRMSPCAISHRGFFYARLSIFISPNDCACSVFMLQLEERVRLVNHAAAPELRNCKGETPNDFFSNCP